MVAALSGASFLRRGTCAVSVVLLAIVLLWATPAVRAEDNVSGVEYLIIYSPDVAAEALWLRDHRQQHGLESMAIDVTTIPGYHPDDPIPAECDGYLDECYAFAGQSSGVPSEIVPSLFGMVNAVAAGQNYDRVPDRAGLIRATLRRIREESGESLRYVLLMGDPELLPPRFTTRTDYLETPLSSANFTLPTDYYYVELYKPWSSGHSLNYGPISPLIFPCGKAVCDEPNTDNDPRHFVHPVRFEMARIFKDPLYNTFGFYGYPYSVLGKMLRVGRLTSKNPEDIAAYLDKLAAWERQPRRFLGRSLVTVADGLYDKSDTGYTSFGCGLEQLEAQLGEFTFFGEGFGSGYFLDGVVGGEECEAHRPPVNDWDAPDWDDMAAYQTDTGNSCKPDDPLMPGYSLPDPREVCDYISDHGFVTWFATGHGSARSIGFNTDINNQRPRRQFGVPVPPSPSPLDYDIVPLDMATWESGPNGFMVSGACHPAEYLGGFEARSVMRDKHSVAEYFAMVENAGGVGSYMNYLNGTKLKDTHLDVVFANKLRAAHDTGTNRVGDAVRSCIYEHLKRCRPTYPHSSCLNWLNRNTYDVMNRTFFGDPAAIIACRDACPALGQRQCTGATSYTTCSLEPPNECLGWSERQFCDEGELCQDGQCVQP